MFSLPAKGQQPQWRPSRIPENSRALPLSSATPNSQRESAALSSPGVEQRSAFLAGGPTKDSTPEQLGGGVVLRWKTVRSQGSSTSDDPSSGQAAQLRQQVGQELAQAASSSVRNTASPSGNPLRSQVMPAAYQQPGGEAGRNPFGQEQTPPALPFGGAPLPNLPNSNSLSPSPLAPLPRDLRTGPDSTTPGASDPSLPAPETDPLQTPELPPPPNSSGGSAQPLLPPQKGSTQSGSGSILEDERPMNPFPTPRNDSDASASDNQRELVPPPGSTEDKLKPRADDNGDDADEGTTGELKRRNENADSGYCNEMRSRIHANPITGVSLDISPKFGAGIRAKKDPEQQRLDFASSAVVRDWTDYRGYIVATGRLIDLRDDRVVIDVDGREQLIPVRELSDVDVAYLGESWNIPERCGTGYDPFRGRNHVPATVQWAASGLCHKPLYFEQVQLERYGHETGPVLQPLISTAHFFGNITLLPYKMGIHPPSECQYSLGYFRPGNCAPYMIQPIPWSLRGAAAQAVVVTGGAALIP